MTGERVRPALAEPSWRDDPDGVRPVVLVIGGFLTSPPLYVPFARRLARRGAVHVVIGRVWTPDWLLAPSLGLGPSLGRATRSLRLAERRAHAASETRGAPVLVVGHSAGGVLARLLTSPEPFDGRRVAAASRIGALVTLGTPHHVSARSDIGGRIAAYGSTFADRVVPGAAFAPAVGYVTVASRSIPGTPGGGPRGRTALRFYRGLLGSDLAALDGDGLVPVESALLDGATRIVLDEPVHGQLGGRPWYGSEEAIDDWWPAALEAWHAALRARVDGAEPTLRSLAGPGSSVSAGPGELDPPGRTRGDI